MKPALAPTIKRDCSGNTATPSNSLPLFVKFLPHERQRGKNDAADAAAICEAVTPAQYALVPVKEEHQQILTLHRTRQGFVEERTAIYKSPARPDIEFGIVLPQKVTCLHDIGQHLEDRRATLTMQPATCSPTPTDFDVLVAEYDKAIAQAAREDARSKRLMQLPRHRPHHRQRTARQPGGAHEFDNGRWSPPGSVSPRPVQQRRQSSARPHHQGRRQLPGACL